MTATTLSRRYLLGATVALCVAAAGLVTALGLWPNDPTTATASNPALPAWFQPISRYYNNDPRITPKFDFASLYSSWPEWFEPIRVYYGYNPRITPQFDFASLYGPPETKARP
jgi:hypothetical protein